MIQKKDLTVLFIVQAGKKFGIGHLKRALQISEFYSKSFIWVLTDLKDPSYLRPLLLDTNHQISTPNDRITISDILKEFDFNLIVNDCIHLNDALFNTITTCTIPMISLDNHNLGICSEIYVAPFPAKKTKHANFTEIYQTPINQKFFLPQSEKNSITKILITLGGSDPNNNAERLVKALKDTHYQITVIAGPLSHYKIEEQDNVKFIHNVSDLFPYIQENDLVFCGPGSTLLESLAAKKYVIAIAHNYNQYQDISSSHQINSLLGSIFLTPKRVKKAIEKSASGKLNLPDNFNFQEWFLTLSDTISGRPASCPLCGSSNKRSFLRNTEKNLFSCVSCNSTYTYSIESTAIQTDGDNIIADNSEQSQQSYKQGVLNLREDSKRRIQIIKKILPIPNHHTTYRLIDLGAEHGIFVQEASHNGFSAHGVELSSFARRVALDNHNLKIIDSMEKIYEQGPVHKVITAWKKLELLENPLAYIQKLSTLIPIGGLLAFRVPIVDKKRSLNTGYFRITEKGGKLLAERAGFIVAQVHNYTNENKEEFLEFYCIKRIDS